MQKTRLDHLVFQRGLVASRSQAESWIRLGNVKVNGRVVDKPGYYAPPDADITLQAAEQYVSRAALKLASVAETLDVHFQDAVVLDVGSSTGGFTDYALRRGARRVIAVDVGTEQLHPSLRGDKRIELHEQTDIRDIKATSEPLDIVVIDVSFISLREVLSHIRTLCGPQTCIIAMVKPQFEAAAQHVKHKGVIKNDRMRRDILKRFEEWAETCFYIGAKADSAVAGSKGNVERFYLLRPLNAAPGGR